jgi:hypothetical protein
MTYCPVAPKAVVTWTESDAFAVLMDGCLILLPNAAVARPLVTMRIQQSLGVFIVLIACSPLQLGVLSLPSCIIRLPTSWVPQFFPSLIQRLRLLYAKACASTPLVRMKSTKLPVISMLKLVKRHIWGALQQCIVINKSSL